ncbi:MAG: exonuclease SbcCD subunit D [Anaerolineae bacterium]|nr:exonuclease SbcCD subunit D [Anaerolineae bacterium]
MIKIVHFADIHLGVENYGRFDPDTGLSTRLIDFLHAMDAVIDAALEQKADLVLFAGDAYKTRDPSPTWQREFARRIRRLSLAGVPTVLVAGNHDMPNAAGRAHALEIFGTLEVDNVYVARSPDLFDIGTPSGRVQVGVLPWVARSGLLARDVHKNKSLQETTVALLEHVEAILSGADGLTARLGPDVPHVLVAHGTVQGAVYGSERSVMLGNDIVLPLHLLKNPAWDYVALGHIHKHQALEDERFPPVVYSGSVERIDFGEEKEVKGFVIAQVERGGCTWEFVPLDTRPFVTVRVQADGVDPTAQIVDQIARAPIKDAVVRVLVQTTVERNPLIDEKAIFHALDGAFYVASIVRSVSRPERMRLGGQQDMAGLTPLDVLVHYLQVKQVPEDHIEQLMQYATALDAAVRDAET